ncbi:MAG: serine hydrolase [Myxococcota bacterium]
MLESRTPRAAGLALLLAGCLPLPTFTESTCVSGEAPAERIIDAACEDRLLDAFEASSFDSVVIMDGQTVVFRAGDSTAPSNVASVRKSMVSVLYGMARDRGLVDLDATLADLDIDDATNPLTETERSATLRQVLQARSGVYLPALGQDWPNADRGADAPGETFWYKNWDFNVLSTIFADQVGLPLEEATMQWLAEPLGMQKFCAEHLIYEQSDGVSEHAMYRYYMNAEDLALIGALVANDGMWSGESLVSEAWLDESTAQSSDLADLQNQFPPEDPYQDAFYDGYGYMWWTQTDRGYVWADGAEGQRILVDRSTGFASVGRNNSGNSAAGEAWYWIGQFQALADESHVSPELLEMHEIALECAR